MLEFFSAILGLLLLGVFFVVAAGALASLCTFIIEFFFNLFD